MLRAILVSELRSKSCRSPDLQSEGTKLGILSPLQRFGQGPSCSPHRLVSQSAMLKEESVHGRRGAKYKTYCLRGGPRVILSTSKAFYYICSRSNEINWAPEPSKFVNKITVKDGWEIPFVTYSLKGIAPNFDKSSEYDLKIFQNVLRSLWYL